MSNIWLSEWTDDPLLANSSQSNTSEYQNKNYLYLGVYAGLGIGQGKRGFVCCNTVKPVYSGHSQKTPKMGFQA